MARLSVNVNKVATIRNSRGGHLPSVIEAVRVCIDAGAPGITVHPRADERHIRRQDVLDIADELAPLKGVVEFNIEGDPRPDLVELVMAVRPDQCTLVPVFPITATPAHQYYLLPHAAQGAAAAFADWLAAECGEIAAQAQALLSRAT